MQIEIIHHPTNSRYDWVRIGPAFPDRIHMERIIGLRQAKIVAKNVLDGKPYAIASPMYELSRPEIAAIHTNASRILNA